MLIAAHDGVLVELTILQIPGTTVSIEGIIYIQQAVQTSDELALLEDDVSILYYGPLTYRLQLSTTWLYCTYFSSMIYV